MLCSLVLLVYAGCTPWEDLEWDVGVSAPLVRTVLGIEHIVPDTIGYTDEQGMAGIDFKYKVFELNQDTLFRLDEALTDLAYHLPLTITLQPGQHFINTLEETTFGFQGAEIRTLVIDRGSILLTLTNPLEEVLVCEYSIPGSSKGGSPLKVTATVPAASGNAPGKLSKVVDVSGYTINLTGSNGFGVNQINVQIDTRVAQNGQPVQVTPFDTLRIRADFSDLTLKEAHGYFGQHYIQTGKQSTRLDLFDMISHGDLIPDTLSARIRIQNGAGFDLRIKLHELTARNSKTNTSVSLQDPFIGAPVNISRATRNQSTGTVTPVEQVITLNPATTKQMFSIYPDHLDWDLDMEVNPLGNMSMGNDFMFADHPVRAWFELLIPLRLNLNQLTLQQQLDFYYSSSGVHSGTLYLIADNRFPFDATVALVLLDENGQAVDSLQPAGTILAAIGHPTGNPTSTRTILTIPVDEERMTALTRARTIDLEVMLNTVPVGEYVAIRADDYMNLIISTNLNATINP